jgi:hypothetical protein
MLVSHVGSEPALVIALGLALLLLTVLAGTGCAICAQHMAWIVCDEGFRFAPEPVADDDRQDGRARQLRGDHEGIQVGTVVRFGWFDAPADLSWLAAALWLLTCLHCSAVAALAAS